MRGSIHCHQPPENPMPKGQQRSNREKKKPKQPKKPVAPAMPRQK